MVAASRAVGWTRPALRAQLEAGFARVQGWPCAQGRLMHPPPATSPLSRLSRSLSLHLLPSHLKSPLLTSLPFLSPLSHPHLLHHLLPSPCLRHRLPPPASFPLRPPAPSPTKLMFKDVPKLIPKTPSWASPVFPKFLPTFQILLKFRPKFSLDSAKFLSKFLPKFLPKFLANFSPKSYFNSF